MVEDNVVNTSLLDFPRFKYLDIWHVSAIWTLAPGPTSGEGHIAGIQETFIEWRKEGGEEGIELQSHGRYLVMA